jgi:hypothetical protein
VTPMSAHDFASVMADVGKALLAVHVATSPLHCAQFGDDVEAVIGWARPAGINNVPVRRDGRVVGVLENINGDYDDRPALEVAGRAAHAMRPLEADILLEARTPLDEMVGVLLSAPHYRLVLHGGGIDAIVTPSDLVKLPMRVMVFGAVAHLEQAMLDALRRLFGDDESALAELDADHQVQICGLYDKLRQRDLDPSLMDVASLRQKSRVLIRRGVFGDSTKANADFDDIVGALRNPVMHATAFVDDSVEALRALDRRLRAVAESTRQAHQAGAPKV